MKRTDKRLVETWLGNTELWTATSYLGCIQVSYYGQYKECGEEAD